MSRASSVVWSEGMFLAPQHFQQWDRFAHGELSFLRESVTPFAWGFRRLEIDRKALANGDFLLLELETFLPDGTAVRVPDVDMLPAGRSFREQFLPDLARMEVFLAVPEARASVPLCRLPDQQTAADCRFLGETVRVADNQHMGQEQDVVVGRHNLKVLFGGENRDGHTVLKMAEIERDSEGAFVLAPLYAPPSISMAAADVAAGIFRSIVEGVSAKSAGLAQQGRASGNALDLTNADVRYFLALHTVNQAIPVLMHFQRTPQAHPSSAYLALSQLAGALCAFAADVHPRIVPAYEHERLGPTFDEMRVLIRDLLAKISPPPYDIIPLVKGRDELLIAEITNERWLDPATHWYLQAGGESSDTHAMNELPRQVIIGTPHNISYLRNSAQPGVVVVHVAVPPRELPLRPHHSYFRIEKKGEAWEAVRESQKLAIHLVGPVLKGLSYELFVLR